MWCVFLPRQGESTEPASLNGSRKLQVAQMPATGNVEAVLRRQMLNVGQLLALDDMHTPHLKWLLARFQAGTPFVHSLHGTRHGPASHQFSGCWIPTRVHPCRLGMEQLSSFCWKFPCLLPMVTWNQPNLVFHSGLISGKIPTAGLQH